MNEIKEIKKIQADQKKLMDALNAAAEKAFPPDSIVCFHKGRGWRTVEIVSMSKSYSHHNDPHFLVRNLHTGAEYHIDLYWLMNEAHGGPLYRRKVKKWKEHSS